VGPAAGAVAKNKKRLYRQYMNRKGTVRLRNAGCHNKAQPLLPAAAITYVTNVARLR
jgi:hypothetical protein